MWARKVLAISFSWGFGCSPMGQWLARTVILLDSRDTRLSTRNAKHRPNYYYGVMRLNLMFRVQALGWEGAGVLFCCCALQLRPRQTSK